MTLRPIAFACGVLLALTGAATQSANAAPGDSVRTATKPVSEVLVETDTTNSYYYFRATGGWEVPNCSGVTLAYISASAPGADGLLAAALMSRSSLMPVSFSGICGDVSGDTNYIQIRGIAL